jgi:hypothetical protein
MRYSSVQYGKLQQNAMQFTMRTDDIQIHDCFPVSIALFSRDLARCSHLHKVPARYSVWYNSSVHKGYALLESSISFRSGG